MILKSEALWEKDAGIRRSLNRRSQEERRMLESMAVIVSTARLGYPQTKIVRSRISKVNQRICRAPRPILEEVAGHAITEQE